MMGRRDRVFRGTAECKTHKLEVTRSQTKDGWWCKSENSRDESQSGRQGLASDTKRDLLASETTREGSRTSTEVSDFTGWRCGFLSKTVLLPCHLPDMRKWA